MNRAIATLAAALCMTLPGALPSANATSPAADPVGPPLLTSQATLDAALSCSPDLATATKTPILLVTGTVESPKQAWSWGYQPVLRSQGHAVCTVSLPNEGSGDMQEAVEYVVNATRRMHAASGRKISMIGHSQGGLLIGWSLRFWPDMPSMVDDAIALDSPFRGGVTITDAACSILQNCPGLVWQIGKNSGWSQAMTRFPIASGPSVTSIAAGAGTDLVKPVGITGLDGASNIQIADLCEGRTSGHVQMLADAAAYALVQDALTHAGPANIARTGTSSCSKSDFDGVDQAKKQTTILLLDDVIRELLQAEYLPTEPPLRDYALGKPGDVNLSLNKPATASTTQAFTSHTPDKAFDGNHGSRWASKYWFDPSWVSVDLGATRTTSGVQLEWESAYARSYQIQVNTGSGWQTVYSTTSGNGGNDFIKLNDVPARQVRMLGTKRGTPFGYSLYEMTVVGH